MRAAYAFTRSQIEASVTVDADSTTRRTEALPNEEIIHQLRDLFLLLDPNGTGLVARDDVLSILFCSSGKEEGVLLPWQQPPHRTNASAIGGDGEGGGRRPASLADSGVCTTWTMAPAQMDFWGLLQLCTSSCLGPRTEPPATAAAAAAGATDGCGSGIRKDFHAAGAAGFAGVLHWADCCGEEQHPSALLSPALSPLSRLRHATRGGEAHVGMSDDDVLALARAFRVLDEGEKGFLDVVDVARGLLALTSHALVQRERLCQKQDGLAASQREGSPTSLRACLAKQTRTALMEGRGEHAIFLEMAQKMILCAILGLADQKRNTMMGQVLCTTDAVSDASDAALPLCSCGSAGRHSSRSSSGSGNSASADKLQSCFARVAIAEAEQSIPLILPLPVFIRSYQCRTGALPPQFASLGEAWEGEAQGRDGRSLSSPTLDDASVTGSVAAAGGGGEDGEGNKENAAPGLSLAHAKRCQTDGGVQATAPPPRLLLPVAHANSGGGGKTRSLSANGVAQAGVLECGGDSVASGRRSISGSAGGPPITTISPFELALLTHLVLQYADQLCMAPPTCGKSSEVAHAPGTQPPPPPPPPPPPQEVPVKPSSSTDTATPTYVARKKYVPHTVTPPMRDHSLRAVRALSDPDEDHYSSPDNSDLLRLSPRSTNSDDSEEPDVAPVGPPQHMDAAAATAEAASLRKGTAQDGERGDALGAGVALLPTTFPMRAMWPEAAARGVPLVPLQSLEKHLLLELDPYYANLEEVRWVLAQRLCEVARTKATYLYKGCEVVNLEDVVECLSAHPEELGLAIESHEQRLRACLALVSQSMPRSVVALVVELMVELGLHKPRDVVSADPDSGPAVEALAALAVLQRRLPTVLADHLDVQIIVAEGLTRFFTSCAEPCIVPVTRGRTGVPYYSYLSLESLLSRLMGAALYAAPPVRRSHCLSFPVPSFSAYHCRRLSELEISSLSAAVMAAVAQHDLLVVGAEASLRFPTYAEQPQLFLRLSQHLAAACPRLCATRRFIADTVAARVVAALRAVRRRMRDMQASSPAVAGGDGGRGPHGHAASGWERRHLHLLVFSSRDNSLGDGGGGRDRVVADAWGEYAATRCFAALGPEGCRQVSLALCRMPLWRHPTAPAPPSGQPHEDHGAQTGKVLVSEEGLVSGLAAVLRALRPDWAEDSLAHAVWDVVGSCPVHTGTTQSRMTIVDLASVLRHFLEAFPVLSPRLASLSLLDLPCHITDVQSVYYALKRLVADSPSTTTTQGVESKHAQRQQQHHTRGKLTKKGLAIVAGSPTARQALPFVPVHSGTVANGSAWGRSPSSFSPSAPHPSVLPVPFDRLKAILEADGLLYVLCALGSQDALTGEVTHMSQVLKALSLTDDHVRVSLPRLSRCPSVFGDEVPKPTRVPGTTVDITLRARALALAMPARLQHAVVQLFCNSIDPHINNHNASSTLGRSQAHLACAPSALLDRHRLCSFVLGHLERRGALSPEQRRLEEEEALVAWMDSLFDTHSRASEGHAVQSRSNDTTLPANSEESRTATFVSLTFDEFATAVFRERSSMIAAGLAAGCGDGASDAGTSHARCSLDVLCDLFSPLAPSLPLLP